MKKQIPGAPSRRARRHALSSFDQLNEAERERLGKINPLHKRYVVTLVLLLLTFLQYLRDKRLKGIGQRVRIHGDGVKGNGVTPLKVLVYFVDEYFVIRFTFLVFTVNNQCRPRSSTVHETQTSSRRHSFPPDKRNRSRTASNFNEIQRRAAQFGNKVRSDCNQLLNLD